MIGYRDRDLRNRLANDAYVEYFGVGFGSFYYLKHLPFDLLKIDGEFVTAARVNSADALIVTTIRDLAHGMGAQVVAEFCSDQAHYD